MLPCEWLRLLTVYVLREMRDAMASRQMQFEDENGVSLTPIAMATQPIPMAMAMAATTGHTIAPLTTMAVRLGLHDVSR